MKRFIIEREIPGASGLTVAELAEISKQSNIAAESLGVPYRWVNSYVAGDKLYCVHEADDEDLIREPPTNRVATAATASADGEVDTNLGGAGTRRRADTSNKASGSVGKDLAADAGE
jgi:hypothetical protein